LFGGEYFGRFSAAECAARSEVRYMYKYNLNRSIVMQYGTSQTSKLAIVSDKPVGMSSSVHGANLDAVGFNMSFIMVRQPQLAAEIMAAFRQTMELSVDDPKVPHADNQMDEARQQLQQTFKRQR
jgi:hypothetical protein